MRLNLRRISSGKSVLLPVQPAVFPWRFKGPPGKGDLPDCGIAGQDAYLARYNGLVDRYETAKAKVDALQKRRSERLKKSDAIGGFMFALSERESPLDTFTAGLWIDSVDLVTVHADGTTTFRFLNGSEIDV